MEARGVGLGGPACPPQLPLACLFLWYALSGMAGDRQTDLGEQRQGRLPLRATHLSAVHASID
jgi:hypothetical protein